MPAVAAPPIGAVLDGKYRVEGILAEGGMGVVLLATHLQLDRRVAIKYLRASARVARGILEQFEREAKLAAQIRSEHVVRVHDVGALPELGPYMVMEYLDGESLGSILDDGPLPIPEAVDYVLQACDALAEVHALEIVHRDLKPDNLFLARRPPHAPIVKLIDFGISKAAPKRGQSGEWSSETVGTPSYMSPEQLESGKVDVRADIWALGVVLYELLTGRLPFEAANVPDLCTAILIEDPVPPSRLRPDLPLPLEAAILHCLAKGPKDRIESVLALAEMLGPFARPTPTTDRVQRVAHASRSREADARAAKTMLVARKRRTWIPVVLGVSAVLAISGTALVISALRTKPTVAAVPVRPADEAIGHADEAVGPADESIKRKNEPPAVTPTAVPSPAASVVVADPAPHTSVTAVVRPAKRTTPRAPAAATDPRAGFGERR